MFLASAYHSRRDLENFLLAGWLTGKAVAGYDGGQLASQEGKMLSPGEIVCRSKTAKTLSGMTN